MRGKLSTSAALIAVALALVPTMVSSAPAAQGLALSNPTGRDGNLVQQAQWWGWGYCRRWRHECAERWSWRTRHYFICLRRHGC